MEPKKLDGASTKRRVWDRDEYRRRAEAREAEGRISELPKPRQTEKRKDLEARDQKIEFNESIGKTVLIGSKGGVPKNLGFYCEVCECSMKDSASYTDHLNGKKHQKLLGMSMRVSEVSAKDVRNRIKDNKRKLEVTTAKSREEELHLKKKLKEQKKEDKERKRKEEYGEQEEEPEWVNEEEKLMAEMMGIPLSFGGSKKT